MIRLLAVAVTVLIVIGVLPLNALVLPMLGIVIFMLVRNLVPHA